MAEYIKREEARKALLDRCVINGYGGCTPIDIEYELERIPSADVVERKTGNEDLISRRAAIDALNEHRSIFCDNTPETFRCLPYDEKCRVDEIDNAVATLVNLPSAQPERKKGKWKEYGEPNAHGKYELWYYTCSLCGAVGVQQYNYCPNCGKKMVT